MAVNLFKYSRMPLSFVSSQPSRDKPGLSQNLSPLVKSYIHVSSTMKVTGQHFRVILFVSVVQFGK